LPPFAGGDPSHPVPQLFVFLLHLAANRPRISFSTKGRFFGSNQWGNNPSLILIGGGQSQETGDGDNGQMTGDFWK
jgi:hypothetical protein